MGNFINKTCVTCACWAQGPTKNTGNGTCHRNPPVVFIWQDAPLTIFPNANDDDFCVDGWTPRSTTEKESRLSVAEPGGVPKIMVDGDVELCQTIFAKDARSLLAMLRVWEAVEGFKS